jgi:hypothetical protein
VADWTEFPPSVFLPGEPITSPQGLGLFENVEAQAEGAPNAPRNRPLSMDILIGGQSFEMSDTTPVNFVDLAGLSSLILVYFAGTYNGQVGFSTDNGLNWSAYFSLPNLADGTVERTSHYINAAWQAEALAFVAWRDQVWAAAFAIDPASVETLDDVIAAMPPMQWPE